LLSGLATQPGGGIEATSGTVDFLTLTSNRPNQPSPQEFLCRVSSKAAWGPTPKNSSAIFRSKIPLSVAASAVGSSARDGDISAADLLLRIAKEGSERILVVMNFQSTPQTVEVDMSGVAIATLVELTSGVSSIHTHPIAIAVNTIGTLI